MLDFKNFNIYKHQNKIYGIKRQLNRYVITDGNKLFYLYRIM
jgi:hypothetical protein